MPAQSNIKTDKSCFATGRSNKDDRTKAILTWDRIPANHIRQDKTQRKIPSLSTLVILISTRLRNDSISFRTRKVIDPPRACSVPKINPILLADQHQAIITPNFHH